MALLLRQRGWLPLHASGVAVGGHGLLFIAPSGSGKSTTAAAFLNQGHTVLTDDIAPVRIAGSRCELCSSAFRLKLLEDAALFLAARDLHAEVQIDKHCFELGNQTPMPVPVISRVYFLADGDSCSLTRVRPLRTASMLSENTFFTKQQAKPEVVVAHLRQCAQVAATVPASILTRPRDFTQLSSVVRLVEKDLGL